VPFLSKTRLLAFRQCPRRLWLELHDPQWGEGTSAPVLRTGWTVGAIAREIYDPAREGILIESKAPDLSAAREATSRALRARRPIFEAAFAAGGAHVSVDVLLPTAQGSWRMIEVKSSTSVKAVQREDLAVQTHVVRQSGVALSAASLAFVDSSWTYPGDGNYEGLLKEVDLTEEIRDLSSRVPDWIAEAQAVANAESLPDMRTGKQCSDPYPCPFSEFCKDREPRAEYPIAWLPRFSAQPWVDRGIIDLRDLPESALNPQQRRVRDCTLQDRVFFDRSAAATDLAPHGLPAMFLDFETIQFAVPIWPGTRPYEQIPFQYSLHRLDEHNTLHHWAFLDLSGNDPSRAFAEQLIVDAGKQGAIFVYNAGFERSRLDELASHFPDLRASLQAIVARIVDLLPIARKHYYHPAQRGSWSIKAGLPAAVPKLSYENLEGVQDGAGAQEAFLEAIDKDTEPQRREELRQQLSAYCALDTYAMVQLWSVFAGKV